jgi:hypothetical protein
MSEHMFEHEGPRTRAAWRDMYLSGGTTHKRDVAEPDAAWAAVTGPGGREFETGGRAKLQAVPP